MLFGQNSVRSTLYLVLNAFLFASFVYSPWGHKPGVANLLGARAKLFGKILEKSNFCPCS
jgi:hypothetical protein